MAEATSAPPAMESTLPTPSPDAPMRLSESATTVRDADVTPEAVKQLINDSIEGGGYHYFPITNDATVDSAARRISSDGFVSALREWTANVHNGQTSAEVVATGQLLYNLAVKSGDTKLALGILSDYQILGTNTAQALQAMSIIKNQTPEGKLYLMNKDVQRLNEGMSERAKRKHGEVRIDPKLADAFLKAETDGDGKEMKKTF